jgi:hypothetical protein
MFVIACAISSLRRIVNRGPGSDDDIHELDYEEFVQCIKMISSKAKNDALRDAIVRQHLSISCQRQRLLPNHNPLFG